MQKDQRQARIAELDQRIREDQAKRLELLRAEPQDVDDRELLSWTGSVRLSELFAGKQDLLFVHNMGARCPYCTLWADGFNGIRAHLEDRTAVVVCSPDPPEAQQRFAEGRGWRFRMVHDPDGVLTRELGYLEEREGKRFFLPGVSALRRDETGRIHRSAHDAFGPGDPYCGLWPLFALLDGGAGGWEPRFHYE